MLEIDKAVLAVIDVQGKLVGLVHEHDQVLAHIKYFIKASQAFDLPVLWSEQAPDKIGGTVAGVKDLLSAASTPILKRSFSCLGCPEYLEQLQRTNRRQVILTGIETHVCVYQTASDLYRHGYEVHVVADAVSSRYASDHHWAITRMREEGIIITSVEMAMCELLKTADHPKFKEIIVHLKR